MLPLPKTHGELISSVSRAGAKELLLFLLLQVSSRATARVISGVAEAEIRPSSDDKEAGKSPQGAGGPLGWLAAFALRSSLAYESYQARPSSAFSLAFFIVLTNPLRAPSPLSLPLLPSSLPPPSLLPPHLFFFLLPPSLPSPPFSFQHATQ